MKMISFKVEEMIKMSTPHLLRNFNNQLKNLWMKFFILNMFLRLIHRILIYTNSIFLNQADNQPWNHSTQSLTLHQQILTKAKELQRQDVHKNKNNHQNPSLTFLSEIKNGKNDDWWEHKMSTTESKNKNLKS